MKPFPKRALQIKGKQWDNQNRTSLMYLESSEMWCRRRMKKNRLAR